MKSVFSPLYKSHSHTHTGIINIGKACYINVVRLSDMFCAVLRTSFALTFVYYRHERASFQVTWSEGTIISLLTESLSKLIGKSFADVYW
jgi:hypothetical protein